MPTEQLLGASDRLSVKLSQKLDSYLERTLDGPQGYERDLAEGLIREPESFARNLALWADAHAPEKQKSVCQLLQAAFEGLIPPSGAEDGPDTRTVKAGILLTANLLWGLCADEEVRALEAALYEGFSRSEENRSRSVRQSEEMEDEVTSVRKNRTGTWTRFIGALTGRGAGSRARPVPSEDSLVDLEVIELAGETAIEETTVLEQVGKGSRIASLVKALSAPDTHSELIPLFVAAAREAAEKRAEPQTWLERLQRSGLDEATIEAGLREISPTTTAELESDAGESASSPMALDRIVTWLSVYDERTDCLRTVLRYAIEQLNAGQVGQARVILDLFEALTAERQLRDDHDRQLRLHAAQSIDVENVARLAENDDTHEALRLVLDSFPPFRAAALMSSLLEEKDRDRRIQYLSLLRVHGQKARRLASRMLAASVESSDPWAWFVVRNLIHLLRTIPPDGEPSSNEVADIIQYSRPSQPPQVVMEAASFMSDLNIELGLDVLLNRLRLLQQRLRHSHVIVGERDVEIARGVLSELLRSNDNRARNAALELTLVHEDWPFLYGPALTRLGERDLRSDPTSQERLISTARELVRARSSEETQSHWNETALCYLMTALSGTPTQRVLQLMALISSDSARAEIAERARAIMDYLEPRQQHLRADVSSGDLEGGFEVFTLRQMLHFLSESSATGALHLRTPTEENGSGGVDAIVTLSEGQLFDCRCGDSRGETALLWLLRQPRLETFRFISSDEAIVGECTTITPLLAEAERQTRERMRLDGILPDNLRVKSVGRQPALPAGETDADEVEKIWLGLTSAGLRLGQLEESMGLDSHRLRRLVGFWLAREELEIRTGLDG